MNPHSVIPRQLNSSGFEKCSGRYASPPVPLYSFSPSGLTVIVLSLSTRSGPPRSRYQGGSDIFTPADCAILAGRILHPVPARLDSRQAAMRLLTRQLRANR